MTAPRFKLTSQRQKVSRLPTEPPGRPVAQHVQFNLYKNLNASKHSEHSPDRGKIVKTFRWERRLQRQNLLRQLIGFPFAVEQGFRQGCVLAPLLFNIFFAAVINVASMRFKADKGIMDALVHLRKKRGAGGRREAAAGESVLATPLWGMLYADDAGVVSQSPKELRKMMEVIVVVCGVWPRTVLEAKTEIMRLRAKGMPESTAIFSVEVAGQVHNQTNECVYLGRNVNHNPDLSIEVDRHIRNAWCSFRKYTLELYDRPSAPLEFKIRMLRAEVLETMLYGRVTWSPRACHFDAAPSPLQLLDSLHRLVKAQSRRPPDFLSGHAYQDGK